MAHIGLRGRIELFWSCITRCRCFEIGLCGIGSSLLITSLIKFSTSSFCISRGLFRFWAWKIIAIKLEHKWAYIGSIWTFGTWCQVGLSTPIYSRRLIVVVENIIWICELYHVIIRTHLAKFIPVCTTFLSTSLISKHYKMKYNWWNCRLEIWANGTSLEYSSRTRKSKRHN